MREPPYRDAWWMPQDQQCVANRTMHCTFMWGPQAHMQTATKGPGSKQSRAMPLLAGTVPRIQLGCTSENCGMHSESCQADPQKGIIIAR